jgi:hypothetical protein
MSDEIIFNQALQFVVEYRERITQIRRGEEEAGRHMEVQLALIAPTLGAGAIATIRVLVREIVEAQADYDPTGDFEPDPMRRLQYRRMAERIPSGIKAKEEHIRAIIRAALP